MSNTVLPRQLPLALFLTRLSIVAFLAPWLYPRITSTARTKSLFENYYFVESMPEAVAWGINGLWFLVFLLFAIGAFKRFSYGAVFLFHGVGTLLAARYMIPGTDNFQLLFMAALPALAAMGLLYMLRRQDTILAVHK